MDMRQSASHNSDKRRRRKAARPGEIIDAALDLFVEKGFAATRLEDVARRAGVAKGTLYLYFESKEALFQSVVREVILPELVRAEQAAAEFTGSRRELITFLVNTWWGFVGHTRLAGMPKLMVSEAANFPELAGFYVETVVRRARNMLKRAIEQGIQSGEFKQHDSECSVRLLIAPVVFALIWEKSLAVHDQEQYDIDSYIRTHLDVFLDGISYNNKSDS